MRELKTAVLLTILFVFGTGIIFPFLIYGLAQVMFPFQAGGSLIKDNTGRVLGSALIGQHFTSPNYFHSRPSAAGSGYDAANSGGTNLGPISSKLIVGIKDDPTTTDNDETYLGINDLAESYRRENNLSTEAKIPADAITRSGSGLDPHISPGNAYLQAPRIAKVRNMQVATINKLIEEHIESPFLGLFGSARVNVLALNLALDSKH